MVSNKNLTSEEELLLQDFSRNVNMKSSLIFYGNGFVVSAIPIWLFVRIFFMDPLEYLVAFLLVTAVASYLMAFAYKNTKFLMKHKIAQKRADAVARDEMKKLTDPKMTKKEKDERILFAKNVVSDYEAVNFALFYNNSLFLALVCVLSCVILSSWTPVYNYGFSVIASSMLVALFSTGSK